MDAKKKASLISNAEQLIHAQPQMASPVHLLAALMRLMERIANLEAKTGVKLDETPPTPTDAEAKAAQAKAEADAQAKAKADADAQAKADADEKAAQAVAAVASANPLG